MKAINNNFDSYVDEINDKLNFLNLLLEVKDEDEKDEMT